jgi:sugar lactone lactonase YvrE
MTISRPVRSICCGLAVALFAGCAGGGPAGPFPVVPQTASAAQRQAGADAKRHRTPVRFQFRIPRHRKHARGERYVSQSTASIAVTAFDATHSHKLAATTANTVPGAGGCSAVADASFTCTFTLAVPAGNDTFDVAAYDRANGTGSKLSAIADFPYDVVAGAPNAIAMTLGGIAATLAVTLVAPTMFATGNTASGFRFGGVGGNATQTFHLTAKDAKGNVIVNPGAPVLTLTGGDAQHLTIVAGASSTQFAVTPLAPTATPIAMTATATASTGKPLETHFTLQLDSILYEISCSNTTAAAFAPWSTTPLLTLTNQASGILSNSAMALDAAGNLYLANASGPNGGAVLEFAPGSMTASRTITGLNDPTFIAVDPSGDIYVTEATSDVEEFTSASDTVPSRVLSTTSSPTGIDGPEGLATDGAGNLYVANQYGGIGVAMYASGTSTTPAAILTKGISTPQWLALDSSGNLYVANGGSNNVTEYKPPFSATSSAIHTFGDSSSVTQPQSLAVDALGDVFVANASDAVEFNPDQSVARTITGQDLYGTNLVAADPLGNAYLPNAGANTVGVYAAGSMTASPLYSSGMSGPMDVVVWP